MKRVLAGLAVRGPRRRRSSSRAAVLAAGGAALVVGVVMLLVIVAVVGATIDAGGSAGAMPASAAALEDIPADRLALYQRSGASRNVDWAVLAGIGKVECDHGRSQLAGCNPPGTINHAGARGPMQFLGSTWRRSADRHDPDVAGLAIPAGAERRGYATDADGDGIADPWSPADAIESAARMLRHNGAPDYESALHAYNPSDDYVASVLDYAGRYRAADSEQATFSGSPGDVPLAEVACPAGGTTTVHAQLGPAVTALYAAASDAGHQLCGSGYRSPERQIELRRQNCGTSQYAVYEMPSSQCSPPTATPGGSNHEEGLAIDLSCGGALIETHGNPCFQWLDDHAADYGLANLPSEPWHWSNDGS